MNFPTRCLSFFCFAFLGVWASAQEVVPPNTDGALIRSIATTQTKLVKIFGASAGRVQGYGTGIIVSSDGMIVTSQGVYLDGPQVKVVLHDGREFVATILRRNRTLQLALLKIETADLLAFELSSEPVGEKGDWVLAFSNAFRVADKDEPVSVMIGTIALRSFIDAKLSERDVAYKGDIVLIDAITSNPGAAGGAVTDLDGVLVGVIGKIINSSETNTRLNYAVPSHLVADFVSGKLEETTEAAESVMAKPADLGIKLFALGGKRNPAYVDRIVDGGPAEIAGLVTDDMVISIGGQKIGTVKEFEATVKNLVPGEEVLIIVKRGTQLLRLPITPREAK